MSKAKRKETPEEQSGRLKIEAQRLIHTGELRPTEADKSLDIIVRAHSTGHTDERGE